MKKSHMHLHNVFFFKLPPILSQFYIHRMVFGSLREYSLVCYKFVAYHRVSDFFLCRISRDQTLKLCSQLGKLQRCQSGIHIYMCKKKLVDLFLHAKHLFYKMNYVCVAKVGISISKSSLNFKNSNVSINFHLVI